LPARAVAVICAIIKRMNNERPEFSDDEMKEIIIDIVKNDKSMTEHRIIMRASSYGISRRLMLKMGSKSETDAYTIKRRAQAERVFHELVNADILMQSWNNYYVLSDSFFEKGTKNASTYETAKEIIRNFAVDEIKEAITINMAEDVMTRTPRSVAKEVADELIMKIFHYQRGTGYFTVGQREIPLSSVDGEKIKLIFCNHIEKVIDVMIKENLIFLTEPDEFLAAHLGHLPASPKTKYIKISDAAIALLTQDFNLDEALDHSLRQQYYVIDDNGEISFNDESLKDAVINSLTTHHEGWADGQIEFENLNYWTVYDIMGGEEVVGADMPSDEMIEFSRIWDKLYWKIDLTIQDLVKKGVLLHVYDDEVPNLDYVKISPEYLEREVSDFNLDEAVREKHDPDSLDVQKKIADNILERLINLPETGDGHSYDFLSYMTSYEFFGEGPTKIIVLRILNTLHKENKIIFIDHRGWVEVKISPSYVEEEVKNFNLDEAIDKRAEDRRFFSVKGDKISFDEKKSRDRILDCVGDRMSSDSPAGINDIIMDAFDEYHDEVQSLSFKSSCFAEDYIAALIKKMVSEGVLEIDDGNPAFGNIVKISDRYIDQQTSDFSLDEAAKKDFNLSSEEILVKDEILDLLSKARDNCCWDKYLLLAVTQDLGKKGVIITHDNCYDAIKKLINIGFIEHVRDDELNSAGKQVSIIRLSSDFIEKETKDFTLDENIRSLIRSIILEAKAS
jgi:hypothetical protein